MQGIADMRIGALETILLDKSAYGAFTSGDGGTAGRAAGHQERQHGTAGRVPPASAVV